MLKISEKNLESIQKDPQFAEYISILKVTGKVKNDYDPKKINADQETKLVQDFIDWQRGGSQKPKLENVNNTIFSVTKVYRIKKGGEEYIRYNEKDQNNNLHYRNAEVEKKYGKMLDENGNEVDDPDVLIQTDVIPNTKFTKEECKKLVDRCLIETDRPQFYIVRGNQGFMIEDPEIFVNAAFDEMWKRCQNKERI